MRWFTQKGVTEADMQHLAKVFNETEARPPLEGRSLICGESPCSHPLTHAVDKRVRQNIFLSSNLAW